MTAVRIRDPLARLASRITVVGPDSCWQIGPDPDRYHRIRHDGRQVQAHVLVYEYVNDVTDLTADGWHVHHLCERPACINPDHLARLNHSQHTMVHLHGHPDPWLDRGPDHVPLSDYDKVMAWLTARGQGTPLPQP